MILMYNIRCTYVKLNIASCYFKNIEPFIYQINITYPIDYLCRIKIFNMGVLIKFKEALMDIRFDLYKTFYYVAVTGSFSKAGENLFVSQSAVSQSIKALEKQLNTSLFLRQRRKISLTYEGKLLFAHIEPAFHLIESGEKKLLGIHTLETGEITIGVSDTLCKYYLLPHLVKYHKLYPGIKIKMINRTSFECVQLLKDGQVDFIITNLPNPHLTTTMCITPLMAFHDVFVANKDFEELFDKTLPLSNLTTLPIIMLEAPTTTRLFIDDFLASKGLHYEPEFQLTSIELMMEFARKGLGVTFIPDYCLQDEDSLKPLIFDQLWPKRQLALASHSQLPPSFTAKHFMDFLENKREATTDL